MRFNTSSHRAERAGREPSPTSAPTTRRTPPPAATAVSLSLSPFLTSLPLCRSHSLAIGLSVSLSRSLARSCISPMTALLLESSLFTPSEWQSDPASPPALPTNRRPMVRAGSRARSDAPQSTHAAPAARRVCFRRPLQPYGSQSSVSRGVLRRLHGPFWCFPPPPPFAHCPTRRATLVH